MEARARQVASGGRCAGGGVWNDARGDVLPRHRCSHRGADETHMEVERRVGVRWRWGRGVCRWDSRAGDRAEGREGGALERRATALHRTQNWLNRISAVE